MPQVRIVLGLPDLHLRCGQPAPSVLAAPAPDQAGIRSGRLTGGDIPADPTVERPPPLTAAVVTAYFAA